MPNILRKDAQVFPLSPGRVNLTDGDGDDLHANLIFCVSDGSFDVTFADGTSATISMEAGWVFGLRPEDSIDLTGTAGTFHLSL